LKNLLIIRPRFLGDVVLATGLASVIKSARPDVKVSFLSQAPFTEIFRHDPDWDDVITFDATRGNQIGYLYRFYRDLRRRKFDVVLDLFGNPRTVQMALLSGAGTRVGYRLKGRSWAYTCLAPPSSPPLPSGRRSVGEAYLDQVRALGIDVTTPYRTRIRVTDEEKNSARVYLKGQGGGEGRVVCIAPGASWPAKKWHSEKFVDIAGRLLKRGIQPLILFGPKESETRDYFRARWKKGWMKADARPIRELCALISVSDALLSNDAGPMHIGPAVETPTLGLFGPGEPEIWFPYGSPNAYLHHEVGCSHCGLDECGKRDCMEAITPQEVMGRLLPMIE
jgi:ADP-heptose:LPS heptosyltransferase